MGRKRPAELNTSGGSGGPGADGGFAGFPAGGAPGDGFGGTGSFGTTSVGPVGGWGSGGGGGHAQRLKMQLLAGTPFSASIDSPGSTVTNTPGAGRFKLT